VALHWNLGEVEPNEKKTREKRSSRRFDEMIGTNFA
jgi:hypothetical protein